jgi:DHA1 family bicyclomycin/chloramphenicol resistance-like MFS transporter
MYLPALPAMARDLGASVAETQLTLSVFLIGFAVGQFVYGPVSDKIGRKPVLLAGLALFAVSSVACAARAKHRDPGRDPFRAGAGRRWADRARARHGPGPLRGPARRPRIVPHGLDHGAGSRDRPFARRRSLRSRRLAGDFGVIAGLGLALIAIAALMMPETIRARSPGRLSFGSVLRGFGTLLRNPAYRAYVGLAALSYGGLFAFISGSPFVLQGFYGLGEVPYGLSFAFTVVGYIAGTLAAQRLIGRWGLDRTIGLGVAFLAGGGALMLALVAAGVPSSLAVTGPMALYTAGVGLALPAAQASAMAPFPERAGAASSFLGICQMSLAALVGHLGRARARRLASAAAGRCRGDRASPRSPCPALRGGCERRLIPNRRPEKPAYPAAKGGIPGAPSARRARPRHADHVLHGKSSAEAATASPAGGGRAPAAPPAGALQAPCA